MILPSFIIKITSAFLIVVERWAMTSTARFLSPITLSSASCTKRSLSPSKLLVASSKRRICGFLRTARAIAIRCFYKSRMIRTRVGHMIVTGSTLEPGIV